MGNHWKHINDDIAAFIAAQRMFFVATAPKDGLINLSPKGITKLKVLDERTVAYLDLTGSGNETAAHITENGRITLMFCAFDGGPNIVRLYGRARIVLPNEPEWTGLLAHFTPVSGMRQIFVIDIARVADSCGFGIPVYAYQRERTDLIEFADSLGPERLTQYRLENNVVSLDGLPTGLAADDF